MLDLRLFLVCRGFFWGGEYLIQIFFNAAIGTLIVLVFFKGSVCFYILHATVFILGHLVQPIDKSIHVCVKLGYLYRFTVLPLFIVYLLRYLKQLIPIYFALLVFICLLGSLAKANRQAYSRIYIRETFLNQKLYNANNTLDLY